MRTAMPFHQFQQIRHVDEVVEKASDSWWVYRRNVNHNGALSTVARVVFFARTKKAVDQWLTEQASAC